MPVDKRPSPASAVPWMFDETLRQSNEIYELRNRRLAGVWIPAGLQNGWAWAGLPYFQPAYRWFDKSRLEFRGHVRDGASLSTVYETIPSHRYDYDISFLTDIVTDTGFAAARASLTAGGVFTLEFPIE